MALATSLACLLGAGAAQASNRVFWAESERFASANVEGSGGVQTLAISGTTPPFSAGTVIDSATDRIYWMDRRGNEDGKVLFANLNGSGGGELNIAGASTGEPHGLAIDPVGRRIYWADRIAGRICFANLDGSGGGRLNFGKAGAFPSGVAIDPVARRLYWVNAGGDAANAVSFGNLDGTGEGSLPIGTAVRSSPDGAAIDPVHRRFLWTNRNADKIAFANLDGSGGGNLNTAGATVALATGVAVDPVGGRVYWTNRSVFAVGGVLSFANLDGSGGGGDLESGINGSPRYPLVVHSPRPTAPPSISGSSGPGSQLACSTGAWSGDLVEANFYGSPSRFTYRWSRNGAELPGATSPTLTASLAGGEYRCEVTAANAAGSATQMTPPHRVTSASGRVFLKPVTKRVRPGALRIAILNIGQVEVSGSLSGRAKVKPKGKPPRFAKLATEPFQVPASARVVVRLSLPKLARLQLLKRRKLPVELSATFAIPDGPQQVTERSLTPKLRQQPR